MGVPKIRGTLFGVPYNKDYIIFGVYIGVPLFWETTIFKGRGGRGGATEGYAVPDARADAQLLMAWGSSAGLVLGFAGIGFRFRVFGFIYEVWFGFEVFWFWAGGEGGGAITVLCGSTFRDGLRSEFG